MSKLKELATGAAEHHVELAQAHDAMSKAHDQMSKADGMEDDASDFHSTCRDANAAARDSHTAMADKCLGVAKSADSFGLEKTAAPRSAASFNVEPDFAKLLAIDEQEDWRQ